jgi:hypothetical protein
VDSVRNNLVVNIENSQYEQAGECNDDVVM